MGNLIQGGNFDVERAILKKCSRDAFITSWALLSSFVLSVEGGNRSHRVHPLRAVPPHQEQMESPSDMGKAT